MASSTTTTGTRLQGKNAIVTGGGSGYGEAIATLFAREGANVLICDINDAAGERVAALLPDSIAFTHADVTLAADWEHLMEVACARFKAAPNILVNNAGTSYRNKPTLQVTEDDFDRVFSTNVKSIFLGVHEFISGFLSASLSSDVSLPPLTASIINIASIGATRPRPGLVWYNASKAAVCNATKGLAAEYGDERIRVNAVCPLLGATGLFETFTGVPDTPDNREQFVKQVPLGRLCEGRDVAAACLYLASDDARFVTGVCLDVDGGKGIC